MPKLAPKPFFVLHVIWHPAFTKGKKLAEILFNHYQADWTNRIGAGIGVPVRQHCGPAGTPTVPSSIDLDESETAAIVVLVDDVFASDPKWVALFKDSVKKRLRKNIAISCFRLYSATKLCTSCKLPHKQYDGVNGVRIKIQKNASNSLRI